MSTFGPIYAKNRSQAGEWNALMLLTDNETKVDLLNNEPIAETITRLLRERPDSPVTVGVHGDWGAGKSSVLEMIEARLEGEQDVLCLKFNGWRFQGFEDAKIALIEGIVTGLLEARPLTEKAAAVVKDVFKRIEWLKVARKAGGLALTAFAGIPSLDGVQSIVDGLQVMASDPGQLATKENLDKAIAGIQSIIKPAQTKNVPKEIEEFRKAFDKLLDAAGINQLVVLIDDLDRCLPDTTIETLEAIRLFVFTKRTAFVVAADETMIEYAVRKHFPDLPETTGPRDYARNYLEKLIQVPFRIPPLGETETRIYVTLLLAGSNFPVDHVGYMALIRAARDRLKRPWSSAPLDTEAVTAALGPDARHASDALFLSDQIGPILASGARGNPRQIKRFLNTLLLRVRTAEARGFGSDISLRALAKLMLAERYFPVQFAQIATVAVVHEKGQCEDLAALEDLMQQEQSATQVEGKKQSTSTGETKAGNLFAEWKQSDPMKAWARIQPPLGKLDLRPYLFATKDKKDYFGPATVLGHLFEIAERLMGARFAVQGLDQELRQLAPPEAEKLFDAVKARIGTADDLDSQPPGIEGLVVLVRAHPSLQGRLLDFLDALPAQKLGPWVLKGWEGVIQGSESTGRLQRLVDKWSKSGGEMLKAAASAAGKSRGVGR